MDRLDTLIQEQTPGLILGREHPQDQDLQDLHKTTARLESRHSQEDPSRTMTDNLMVDPLQVMPILGRMRDPRQQATLSQQRRQEQHISLHRSLG